MTFLTTIGAVVTAVALVPSSAAAQHRGGGGGARASGGGQAAPHGVAAPRSVGVPRGAVAPRVYGSVRTGAVAPRSYVYGGPRVYAGQRHYGTVGHAVPRPVGAYPYRYYRPNYYRPGYYRPYPYHFYSPYYGFRPHFSIGFGLWVGYPFAYTYGYYNPFYPYAAPYPYPYGYAYPYPAYGYPYGAGSYPQYPPTGYAAPAYGQAPAQAPSTSVGVQPGQANTGGVSFEITPADAELLVDGSIVGRVGDFTPTTEPLGLSPGRHQIEIRAPGYRAMAFDVDIVAGQVIPYRGALQR